MRPARPRRLNKMAARHRFPGCTAAADEPAAVQLLKGRGGLKVSEAMVFLIRRRRCRPNPSRRFPN